MVEGTVARIFRGRIRPVEIGRRLKRSADDNRTVDVGGRTLVPNHFVVSLSADDHESFLGIESTLCRDLADLVRDYAAEEGYTFMGPVGVEIRTDESQRSGTCSVSPRLREGDGGAGAGSVVLASGERILLGGSPMVIGRLPECEIQLLDANVSRQHAEIRPVGTGFVIIDLGSTNGVRVNGVKQQQVPLRDRDTVNIGAAELTFYAS